MPKIYVARQKIVNVKGSLFGYELLFRDTNEGIKVFPSNLKATSQVLLNAMTHMDLDALIGERGIAFVNADHTILESNILHVLDKERFVIEVLETTELTPPVVEKLAKLKKHGYKIAIDDFDCSPEMIKKFSPVLRYFSLIKIDVLAAERENMKNVVRKFKQLNLRLLAEKIEDKQMYRDCYDMGFDLFQGYAVGRPEVIEHNKLADTVQMVILQLITMVKNGEETGRIELFIKKRPELAYNMIRYINSNAMLNEEISSITQALTFMGRELLLRWLMVYLYAEVESNELSQSLLNVAVKRAVYMEQNVQQNDRERAYMVGMFSTLDLLFDAPFEEIFAGLCIEEEIVDAVMQKNGPLGQVLRSAEKLEKLKLKDVLFDNYYRLEITDILRILENVGVDTSRI